MSRRQKPNEDSVFLFDVLYEDGRRTSNRKVARADLDPFDRDPALAAIERQDREIATVSGSPRGPIRSITRVRP